MCGLTQSIFVSVPAIVIRLDMSNMAEGEWCAHKETVARRIISASNTPQTFCLTVISPLGNSGHFITVWKDPLTGLANESTNTRILNPLLKGDGFSSVFRRSRR